ncbi:iron ABC transporter permease [Oligella ureolytica]|jgi:iron complex transport system permease protein|nr:iron ABC transporter permease [Alcaligenaceae bacterium]
MSQTVDISLEIKNSRHQKVVVLLMLTLLTVLSLLLAMTQGSVKIPLSDLPRLLFSSDLSGQDLIHQRLLIQIRFPRVLLACLAGGVLAVAGAALQALFRNPLAEPGLIGVSAGASLGAVLSIVLLGGGFWGIAPMAFAGSLGATILAYLIGKRYGGVAGLLLAGIAINAIAFSVIGLLTYMVSDTQLRDFTFWSMGSVATGTWRLLAGIVPWSILCLTFLLPQWRAMNVLLLGHQEVQHLGFDMKRLRWRMIIGVSLLIAPLVAVTGGIGFIGLIVPHMVRMLLGSNYRYVLPASLFGGATLLIWADYFARTVIAPAELPVGLLTSMIGGPFFLWLLLKNRSR